MNIKIGFGIDVHRWASNRALRLGGVQIPHHKGLLGHSDADALLHAITDALLGALALGDIGAHFPDTDTQWKDADSRVLLAEVIKLIKAEGYEVGNVDSTVMLEKPKLRPYINEIRESIASILNIPVKNISVKATTNEQMGFIGREEGVAVHAVVLLLSMEK